MPPFHAPRLKLCLLLLLCLSAAMIQAQDYAITQVTVIPMNKPGRFPDQTVLISDGKIRKIGPAQEIKPAKGTRIIQGKGKFLIPGLFDMHAHFFYEQGKNNNTCPEELKVMLANGLTTARIQCGDPAYLYARKRVQEQAWIGPELFVSSPQFVGKYPWPGKVFAEIVETPAQAEAAVRRCKKAGYDEIKITFMVKADVYKAITRAARTEGIKVTGHVGPMVKLPAALDAGVQIEHMDEFIDMLLPDTSYNHGESVSDMNIWRKNAWATVPALDEKKIPALVARVKESGVSVTPTNFFFFSSFGEGRTDAAYKARPDYAYIPEEIKSERWEIKKRYWDNAAPEASRQKYVDLRKQMTVALWKAGVPLMAGSDSPEWFLVQGFSIHDELETFVQCGLSPFAALQTATVNPAQYLGVAERRGSIERGMEASLVLLNADPLEDIRNTRTIEGVMQGNQWHDRAGLDKMLQEAKAVLGK